MPQARRRPASRSTGCGDQRTRLLDAVVEVVADSGIVDAKIGEIASRAGVSRATFYELFTGKEDCFIAAHERLSRPLLEHFQREMSAREPARAAQRALALIGELARHKPAVLSFLTHEALLAGPAAREHHDRLLVGLEQALEHAWGRTAETEQAPNVPARILLGGTIRLCCMQLRRHRRLDPQLEPALQAWAEAYPTGRQTTQRRALLDGRPRSGPPKAGAKQSLPRILPRGRHRLPREVVAAMQRERLATAAAEVASRRGDTSVSVSDIVAAAGVSREVFYWHFTDKEQALLSAFQLIFEQLMAAASSAFFTPGLSWPERVWRAGCAFIATLERNPSFAKFAFICAYGIGEPGVGRVDETALAFALFLEEGYRQSEPAAALPRLIADAIALAIVEVGAFAIRNGQGAQLHRLAPAVAYSALAPFIGTDTAAELVDRYASADADA